MNEGKWTSGPWFARLNEKREWTVVHWSAGENPDDDEPWYVCDVHPACADGDDAATAHLIAAAPTMYEALEWARNFMADVGCQDTTSYPHMQMVCAALAKARGEQP